MIIIIVTTYQVLCDEPNVLLNHLYAILCVMLNNHSTFNNNPASYPHVTWSRYFISTSHPHFADKESEHRETKLLPQSHTASKRELGLEFALLTTPLCCLSSKTQEVPGHIGLRFSGRERQYTH